MIARLLRRAADVKDGEVGPVLWACLYCFFVLASFYVLRPLREEMGIAGGIKNLPRMYLGTLAATIVMVPLFSWLVSRFSRRRFIPIAYRFFALNLVGFYLLFRWLPEDSHVIAARVFYIWLSVFNLFVVTVFWGYMADIFTSGQGKRLFGFIAAGGTLGAVAGAGFTNQIVERVGTHAMFFIAAFVVEAAVQAFRRLDRLPVFLGPEGNLSLDAVAVKVAAAAVKKEERLDRTGFLGGFTLVVRSPYLLAYCLFMLLFTNSSTFAYFEQARFVKAASASPEARTAIFAQMDLLVNLLALFVQMFLTGRVVRWLGLGGALCILPLLSLSGFGALLVWPTLVMLMTFQVLRRGTDYAVSKPTREVLFTVLPREEKYKAKSFIDTFVYRAGDAINAAVYGQLTESGDPARRVALVSVPVTAAWIAVSLMLSRRQQRLAATVAPVPVAPVTRPAPAV
ncbi:MAG TPA: MFS transporter [Candidatus Polarisedimenticolia bacterium]|nr:MFS transporter [Candidatus Polarisedimenticolia bacterium]